MDETEEVDESDFSLVDSSESEVSDPEVGD